MHLFLSYAINDDAVILLVEGKHIICAKKAIHKTVVWLLLINYDWVTMLCFYFNIYDETKDDIYWLRSLVVKKLRYI
jgi:hypothetical protein